MKNGTDSADHFRGCNRVLSPTTALIDKGDLLFEREFAEDRICINETEAALARSARFLSLCISHFLSPRCCCRNCCNVQCADCRSAVRLARIFHELLSRDHEDRRATGQPQGVGSEAYLNGTSQGLTPEDARKDGHIRGRSK